GPAPRPGSSVTSPRRMRSEIDWPRPEWWWRTRPMGRAGFGHRVEGVHAVAAAAAAGRVEKLYVDRARRSRADVAEVVALVEDAGGTVQEVSDVRAVAETSAPQGLVADCRPIPAATLEEVAATSDPAAVLVLDRVVDPQIGRASCRERG